ncbi:MAG: 30S ribosomal protein S4 [Candidatus Omnitrophica bacterium]|nr:30S ribosomal protein S4 [Candidatus Omnitrophota bacterium]
MARYVGPSCRQCRREGIKLFLKGTRCNTAKCAIEKRNFPPGQHGHNRQKLSDYGVQLREKQKMKRIYGVLEAQFSVIFQRAALKKGVTGENLIQILEERLDNVLYRANLVLSRQEGRQFLHHGHVAVNGRKVNIPSFQVKPGDVIEVSKKEGVVKRVTDNLEILKDRVIPEWLTVEKDTLKTTVVRHPGKQDAGLPVEESMIVELYSK